jgi:glycosyltransferase involved in cell wall biosynthesis
MKKRKTQSPIIVLHVFNELLPSGAEVMMRNAAKHWNCTFHHNIVATQKNEGSYVETLRESGYPVYHIYHPNLVVQLVRFERFIRQHQVDIVHIHREGKSLYFAIAARIGGAKIVHTIHNNFAFTGVLRLRRIVTRHLERMLGVTLVAISPSVMENEKRRFGVGTTIVNNWYDAETYAYCGSAVKEQARKRLNLGQEQMCFVSVGNCHEVKNHFSILRGLQGMNNKDVCYLHVGEGAQTEEELAFVHANGLDDQVRYVGHQNPLPYLQAADFFMMPSKFEGVSIAALEAMAVGLPCLLTNVSGLKDFQAYPFDLLTYCELDNDAIADAMRALMEQPAKLENSETQSEIVKQHYNITQGVRGYEAIYTRSLQPKKA